MFRIMLCAVIWVLTVLSVFAQDIPIYVVVPQSDSGFQSLDSKRLIDSRSDLEKDLSKRKGLRIVSSPEEAKLIFEILESGELPSTETISTTRRGIFSSITRELDTKTEVKNLPKIRARMKVQGTDFSQEFTVQEQRFWKDLTKKLGDDIEKWINLNRQKLTMN